MKDFLHREVTAEAEVVDEDGEKLRLCAWRMRTSAGARMIGIEFGKQRIEFTCGDAYEQHARTLIDLMEKVCNHSCELPTTEA